MNEDMELKERSKTNRLIFALPIIIGILILLYPGDISRRYSGNVKIVMGVGMIVVGFIGIIYYSLPHKLVIKSDCFEFWQGKKMKFRSNYEDIKEVECKKTVTSVARIPLPDTQMNIYTARGGLSLSANKHLSKNSLMTFLRKLEEKSFQHKNINIRDRLNWLYQ
jgi:hypothetical protein